MIFNEYKEAFVKANISNEIALLGLIKHRDNPRIDTHRLEIRDKDNFNSELNVLGSFEEYIKNYPNGINKKELMHELCDIRGWKPYQIEFLYSRSNVVYKNNGLYIHANNIKYILFMTQQHYL